MNINVVDVSNEDVQRLLGVEESHFLDLKAIDINPAGVTKAVSAFANTAGGELYIGIEEVDTAEGVIRKWTGFQDMEAANGLVQAIEQMAPLANHYQLEFLRNAAQPGLVAHLTVLKTREILLASNGRAYVRRGAQKLPVDESAMDRLRYDKGIVSFEDELTDAMPDDVANSTTVIDFMLNVVPTGEPQSWLEKQRLISNGRPTVAGTLLFAEEPQAILPKRSAIKIFRYTTSQEGNRETLAFDPITMEGPVYELIYGSVDKAREVVEGIQKLGPGGMESISYPDEALHEIITNAVLHRDYSIPADIQVRIFDNRVEVESPGSFPGHITPQNALTEQFARNPKLVRIVNKFPDPPNKDVGEGLNTAFSAMEKLRLKSPIIEAKENSVMVTLRHERLGSPEQLVLDYMQTHEEITNSIGRDLTGIRSENTMKEVFYRLRERGLLEQVPHKSGAKATWRKPRPVVH